MPVVYVTGLSGSGKSAVCDELNRRGHEAHDTDRDGIAEWVNRTTGAVIAAVDATERGAPGWLGEHEWRVVPSKVQAIVEGAGDRLAFLCGSTANEEEMWHLFSRVIYLAIDEPTLRDRLASRTSNDFGKSPEELAAILHWHKIGVGASLRSGAVVISATLPLDEVVDQIVEAASR
jgi:broad-specificity NMP kinase